MDLTKITNHIEIAQGNLFAFLHSSPKIMEFVAIIVAEIQALENVGYDLIVKRWIANAEGVQLDVIGIVVGEPRLGLSDDDYRSILYIAIDVNHSQGGAAEITNAAANLLGVRVRYRRNGEAGFTLEYLSGAGHSLDVLIRANRLLQRATLCGVNWQMVEGHTTKPFRFGGSPGSGWGDGHLGRTTGSMT